MTSSPRGSLVRLQKIGPATIGTKFDLFPQEDLRQRAVSAPGVCGWNLGAFPSRLPQTVDKQNVSSSRNRPKDQGFMNVETKVTWAPTPGLVVFFRGQPAAFPGEAGINMTKPLLKQRSLILRLSGPSGFPGSQGVYIQNPTATVAAYRHADVRD